MLRHARIPLIALLAVSLLVLVLPLGAAGARARKARPDRVERGVVNLLNAVRQQYGLGRLAVSRSMCRVAEAHSAQMARMNWVGHGNWQARIEHSAGSVTVGEVVGWVLQRDASAQARGIVTAWMHSAPHRAVILTGGYRRLGVGRQLGGSGAFFTVDVAR